MSGGRAIRIGRAPDNDIQVPVNITQVSKHHCQVFQHGTQWVIEDLGSSNHTYVNGVPVRGRATFRLTDSICLGSYEFDTQRLQGPIGGHRHAPAHYSPSPSQEADWAQQPMYQSAYSAAPASRVVGRPTVFDGAFIAEGGWMPQFLLVAGSIMMVLFFVPISLEGPKAQMAMDWIEKTGTPSPIKLALMMLPVTGFVMLILRSLKARRSSVGLAMLLASLPMLLIIHEVGSLDMPSYLQEHLDHIGGRLTLGWIFMYGTACSLMLFSTRPEDKWVRRLLTFFPLAYIALQLMPMDTNGSPIPILEILDGLGSKGKPEQVLLITTNLLITAGASSALWFLSPDPHPGSRKEPAQVLAMAIALLPGIAMFLVTLTLHDHDILRGLWVLFFLSAYQLLPVLGATLLYIGLEEGR